MTIEECRSCRSQVFWAVTSKGASMPVDVSPVADGDMIIDGEARASSGVMRPRVLVLSGGDVPLDDPPRFVSHFVTCPHATGWRAK